MDLAPLSLSLLPHRHLESLTMGRQPFVLWCERYGTTARALGRVIVEKIDNSTDYTALADFLKKNYLPNEIAKTPGDYHSWAETWSIDSVRIASLAYLGFAFGTPELDIDQNLVRIDMTLPAKYLDNNKVYAAEQLTRAGVRLARLLDRIKWQCLAKREDAAALAP